MPGAFPVKGILVPLATPLSARDRLDLPGLERLLEHVIDGGVHGVFLLGTTGEAPSLTDRLKRELIERSAAVIGRRVPLLVGVTDTSLVDSLELAEFAAGIGADAVVAAPAPYFPINQSDLARSMESLADESPLPLFLYNMPSHSKVVFEAETVRALAGHPNVAGIKDSSGDMLAFNQFLQVGEEQPGFAVLMGPEELLAESVLMGGHGGVCGGSPSAAVRRTVRSGRERRPQWCIVAASLLPGGCCPDRRAAVGIRTEAPAAGIAAKRSRRHAALSEERRERVIQHLRDLGLLGGGS